MRTPTAGLRAPLWFRTLLAGAYAVITNALLYGALVTLGPLLAPTLPEPGPLLTPVVAISAACALAGGLLFGLFCRFLDRPDAALRVSAALALLLGVALPGASLLLAGLPHAVAVAITTGTLTADLILPATA